VSINRPLDAAHVRDAIELPQDRLAELKYATSQFVAGLLNNERLDDAALAETLGNLGSRLADVRPGDVPLSPEERGLVAGIVAGVLEPNLVLDLQRLNRAREEAIANVKPIYVER